MPTCTDAMAPDRSSPFTITLSGVSTSTISPVSVTRHCLTCVVTLPDTSAKSPRHQHIASIVWMPRTVSADTPLVLSRSQRRDFGRSSTPPVNIVMFTASDFTEIVVGDQLAQVAKGRIAARLQADHRAHALAGGERGHLFRLARDWRRAAIRSTRSCRR